MALSDQITSRLFGERPWPLMTVIGFGFAPITYLRMDDLLPTVVLLMLGACGAGGWSEQQSVETKQEQRDA